MPTTDRMATTTLLRRPDEPAPYLSDYLVVHRAMTTDLRRGPRGRLAAVLATLSPLLDRHTADEEHGVIRRYGRVSG